MLLWIRSMHIQLEMQAWEFIKSFKDHFSEFLPLNYPPWYFLLLQLFFFGPLAIKLELQVLCSVMHFQQLCPYSGPSDRRTERKTCKGGSPEEYFPLCVCCLLFVTVATTTSTATGDWSTRELRKKHKRKTEFLHCF